MVPPYEIIMSLEINHGYASPRFVTIQNDARPLTIPQNAFEVRKYMPSTWATTRVEGADFDEATRVGFLRLLRYIKEAKIDMTVPVISRIALNRRTLSFFVQARSTLCACRRPLIDVFPMQENAPRPLSSDVFLERFSERTMFVSSFGGWAKARTLDVSRLACVKKLNLSASAGSEQFRQCGPTHHDAQ